MKYNKLILTLSVVILFVICSKDLRASGFLSAGSGALYAKQETEESGQHNFGIPILLEYQYSTGYRDSWMFNSSLIYTLQQGNDSPDNILIYTAGLMYIKPFYFYRSNITETTFKTSSCLGTLLLPFTVIRDTLINFYQASIPQHPFAFFDLALIKDSGSDLRYGFSTGIGITSGPVDLKIRYTQNLRYSGGLIKDLYIAAFEFTFNFPLQDQFIRTEPLIK